MAVGNAYNPNPVTVNDLLKQRQTQADLMREKGLLEPAQAVPVDDPNRKKTITERVMEFQTPNYKDKSLLRKVGEDAAMLAYAIPVGVASAIADPVSFAKAAPGALWQSVKDAVNPEYYKAHPLLGIVNLAGFVQPIAGAVKSAGVKTATNVAIEAGVKQAVAAGADDAIVRTALTSGTKQIAGTTIRKSFFQNAVFEAAKTGKFGIAQEVAREVLRKAGVADDVAIRVGNTMADSLYTTFSRQSTKMKVAEAIAHPVGSSARYVAGKIDPARKALFGSPAQSAVSRLYGAETVAKNPESFLSIERWAEAQALERGMENTVDNRQRIMQDWVDQNTQWAALTPEQRIAHFDNYAKQDLTRLQLHGETGMDIVTTKALPQNYVDSMIETVRAMSDDMPIADVMKAMEDNFGRDFTNNMAELNAVITKQGNREALIGALSRMGSSRSTISFSKFSPPVQELAKQLEKSGYRIAYAPKDKAVSFVTDVFKNIEKGAQSMVSEADILAQRTRLGSWVERLGLSPQGTIEGAAEYSFRENFTQQALGEFASQFGNKIKVGSVTVPVEKLFEWIDGHRLDLQKARRKLTLPIRTVFDVKADDLITAGFAPEVAKAVESMTKTALRDVPASITGLGDAAVNYLKTADGGFSGWMSKWYDRYLKLAYKGRYDWSPFFSAQQYLETKLQATLFTKDVRLLPDFATGLAGGAAGAGIGATVAGPVGAAVGGALGVVASSKIGRWTSDTLSKYLGKNTPYLRQIIADPPIEEVAMVREEVLGNLQKTMLDYTSSPDLVSVKSSAQHGKFGLRDKAKFEDSIRSRNIWYAVTGHSSVRMATTFNKALMNKFGFGLEDALAYTVENGVKKYNNPQLVKMMKESTQAVFHYQPGALTSPLMKTLNIVWFPLRFQAKTVQMMSKWLNELTPASRMVVMNNWVHFANWAGTDEGIEWRRTNRNMLYNILAYTTAFEQMGQSAEAVTNGRLFGGNAGMIGGVPFGVMVNLARELAILPEDPDQFDPKTGKRFTKEIPKKLVSTASLSTALEQLLISMSPSTPFYSLTGGVIAGASPRKVIQDLVQQFVGFGREAVTGGNIDKGKQNLQRDFKRVPLDYSRIFD